MRRRAQFFVRYLDAEIERTLLPDAHDGDGVTAAGAGQKLSDERDGVLRGGEPDALGRLSSTANQRAGRQAVAPADQRFEPLQCEGEVCAAFVVGDGVDLIDDHGVDRAKIVAAFFRSEQDVERLRRGDQDVRRVTQHLLALFRKRVASSDAGANLRA